MLRAPVRARCADGVELARLDLVRETGHYAAGRQFTGHGKNVLGDPRVALTWLANNELRLLGVTLKAVRSSPPAPATPAADSVGDVRGRFRSIGRCRWRSNRPFTSQ
jgi:hypothetical protein